MTGFVENCPFLQLGTADSAGLPYVSRECFRHCAAFWPHPGTRASLATGWRPLPSADMKLTSGLTAAKGDHNGFVMVLSPKKIVIPDRPGNSILMGLQVSACSIPWSWV